MEGPAKKLATTTTPLLELPIDVWQKVMEYADFATLKTLSRTCWGIHQRMHQTQTHRFRWKIWGVTKRTIAMFNATAIKTNSNLVLKQFYKHDPNQITNLVWSVMPDHLIPSLVPALTHLRYAGVPDYTVDFSQVPHLTHLWLENVPKMCDLRPLRHLQLLNVCPTRRLIIIREDQRSLFGQNAAKYNLMVR